MGLSWGLHRNIIILLVNIYWISQFAKWNTIISKEKSMLLMLLSEEFSPVTDSQKHLTYGSYYYQSIKYMYRLSEENLYLG